MLTLLVLYLATGLSMGLTILPGGCPHFTPKTDFEIPPYLGKWLEIARFATEDQAGQTCNYAEYSDNGDGTVGVHNAGLNADGTFNEIFGYVEPTDVPGSLLLHLDGVPVAGSYNVMETDYENFASVFSCTDFLGLGHVEQAWILARSSPITQHILDTALAAFTQWGISTEAFQYTPQEECVFP